MDAAACAMRVSLRVLLPALLPTLLPALNYLRYCFTALLPSGGRRSLRNPSIITCALRPSMRRRWRRMVLSLLLSLLALPVQMVELYSVYSVYLL